MGQRPRDREELPDENPQLGHRERLRAAPPLVVVVVPHPFVDDLTEVLLGPPVIPGVGRREVGCFVGRVEEDEGVSLS